MGKDVYANGNAIACKAGDGKVIAAFPDVCNTPPSPPAGPIPVPYPDSSFSKDLKKGSKSVKIGKKPTALKNQSYFKSSPLGDEPATKTLGGSLITHTITGKTYFGAWSMDVKFEGKNVCRHIDLTTSNHASMLGSTTAIPNTEGMNVVPAAETKPKCECCGAPVHSAAQARASMSPAEYYQPVSSTKPNKREAAAFASASTLLEMAKTDGCDKQISHAPDSKDPCAKHYPASAKENGDATQEYTAMMSPMTPDEYFVQKYGPELGKEIQERGRRMNQALKSGAKSIAHKTPRSGGGCPIGENNLQPVIPPCDAHEEILGQIQGNIAEYHRRVHKL